MTRARRVLTGTGIIAGLILVVTGAGVLALRSRWFREKVRERVVSEAAKTTNGRVEMGQFQFEWKTLTAELDNLTIHGTEPAGQAPLFTVKRLVIGLKIVSFMKRAIDIASIQADAPRTHLIVEADGTTNIPPPQKFKPQMLLDLKVGRFALNDGVVLVEEPGQKPNTARWNARGENASARAGFDAARLRYTADLSLNPLHFQWTGYGALDARVTATAAMQKNQLTIPRATIASIPQTAKTPASSMELTEVLVEGFTNPVVTAKFKGSVALEEVDRVFSLVDFQHTGTIGMKGNARYASTGNYLVTGAFEGSDIGYGAAKNLRAAGSFEADPQEIRLKGARIAALDGDIIANGAVRNFSVFHVAGEMHNFEADKVLSLLGIASLPYNGVLSGPFQASGTLSERNFHGLLARATLGVAPAPAGLPARGELDAKFNGTAGTLEFGPSWIALPASRADFSGIPGQHIDLRLQSTDLNEFRPVITLPADLKSGALSFQGSVSGSLSDPGIEGHAALRNAIYDGEQIDSLTGDVTASNARVTLANTALALRGAQTLGSGSLALTNWIVTDRSAIAASLRVTSGDAAGLLALAGWKDAPFSGGFNTTAQLSGTVGDPHATADLTLTKGQLYGERFDTATARLQYGSANSQSLSAVISEGTRRVNLTARFDHAAGPALGGKLTFSVASNVLTLNQLANVRKLDPELRGMAQVKADGVAQISQTAAHGTEFALLELNGEAIATSLAMGTRSFGDARLTAATKNGVLTAHLVSNAVKAAIDGDAAIRLAGDYPVDAKVTFSDVRLNAVEAMLNPSAKEHQEMLEGAVAGQLMLSGPAKTPDLITATIELNQLEVRPAPAAGQLPALQTLVLRNDGPIRMALARSVVRIEGAHMRGPDTDLQLGGTIAINAKSPLDLTVNGNVNLALAHVIDEDVTSSGEMVINASVRGTFETPDLAGRAEVRNGEVHYTDFVNGLTNANGTLLFNGSRANIQSFTAESGGGKVDATGFVALASNILGFRLETHAHGVRIRYPEGVSSLSDADITVAGTSDRSEASGKVTIRRIVVNPKADSANILATSSEPARAASSRTGLAANMNLDIQVETAPDVSFETSVAQSIEADANLRLRGTVTVPALLGRINITQGVMVFFGNKYTISQGSISFLNPAKIDPILNISVETKARGVDVTLSVSGPVNKLNVSYRSDPPLQFGDIVALLATGRAPTNATLESAGTGQLQNFQQLGASALLGSAISNPTAGRLQRLFGVSNIKLNPQLSGITGNPETRLSIEQQVTPNILFTYDSDVADASTQLIRVELDFSPRWGAILTREQNGYVALDFAYKRRFK